MSKEWDKEWDKEWQESLEVFEGMKGELGDKYEDFIKNQKADFIKDKLAKQSNKYLNKDEIIENFGLHKLSMLEDGNCFYYAMLDQLKNNGIESYQDSSGKQHPLTVTSLREIATNHIRENLDIYNWVIGITSSDRPGGSLSAQDYIKVHNQNKEFADEIIKSALSRELGVNICIVSSSPDIPISMQVQGSKNPNIYLLHSGNHYDSLRPIDGNEKFKELEKSVRSQEVDRETTNITRGIEGVIDYSKEPKLHYETETDIYTEKMNNNGYKISSSTTYQEQINNPSPQETGPTMQDGCSKEMRLDENSAFYKFIMGHDTEKLAKIFFEAKKKRNTPPLTKVEADHLASLMPKELEEKMEAVQKKIDERNNSSKISLFVKDSWNDFVEALGRFLNFIKDKDIPGFAQAQAEIDKILERNISKETERPKSFVDARKNQSNLGIKRDR